MCLGKSDVCLNVPVCVSALQSKPAAGTCVTLCCYWLQQGLARTLGATGEELRARPHLIPHVAD
mgnify:CR=1 FL=1